MLFLPGLLSSSSSFESSCCEYLKIEPPHAEKKDMTKDQKVEKKGKCQPAKKQQSSKTFSTRDKKRWKKLKRKKKE